MALNMFAVMNSGIYVQTAYMGAVATAGASYSPSFVFGRSTGMSSYSETMRIDPTGNVGIGTTAPVYKLDVAGDINTSSCFRIGATTVSGTCTSDQRLKENIRDYNAGLPELLKIKLHTYTFNGLGEMPKTGEVAIGVIAQEVEKTNPELVKNRLVKMHPDDQEKTMIKVVDYSKFSYMLINAVKELYQKWSDDHRKIEIHEINLHALQVDHQELKKQVNGLKSENESLQTDNQAIKSENARLKAYLCKKDPGAPICP